MTTITSRAAAWILAAGLVACMGTPSFATDPSPWPSTAGIVSTDNQQAAPNAASDQTGASAAQPDATDRSLAAEQRPDAMTPATDPNATQVNATSDEGGGWDKASIVGKIFIAAGTLLTLGSAARMFMI